MRSCARWMAHNPSGVLLLVQLAGLVIYPFLGGEGIGQALFGVFSLVVLAIAVAAVRLTPALAWVSALLGLPVVVLTVVGAFTPENATVALWSLAFHAAFYFYTAYALIRYMFDDTHVSRDEIWATGATFTVVAWAFAYLYGVVQLLWPGSFTGAVDPGSARSWMDVLFLSVTTLTNTGLSDIVPIRPQARSVVMVEEIAGMLYVALVIARMITLITMRQERRRQQQGSAAEE